MRTSVAKLYTTAFFADGVGDKVLLPPLDTIDLTDAEPGDSSTTRTVTVDGGPVLGVINGPNDLDFFKVDLIAGKTYSIGEYLYVGGTPLQGLTGIPLTDAYLRLYGPNGTTLVGEADGGGPNTPSGLDALLTFTPTTTGSYYLAAGGFDQDATNGTMGDQVGDYQVFVNEIDPSTNPVPTRFYGNDELLSSIDWGSQFSRTFRNPDGDNGTRTDNGVPNGGTPITESTYNITGKNVITYYFAKQGDLFTSDDPTAVGTTENMLQVKNMLDWEKQAFRDAFNIYEQVADLKYVQVASREDADIKIVLYQGTPGAGASLLGRMSPPGENNAGQAEFNSGDLRWTEEGVSQGGFYFPTLLHELGHGHGMKHPHDNGGGGPLMHGAEPSEDPVEGAIGGQFGDFGLSQQIYTIMSYNDGWNETGGVGGRPAGQGGPSAGNAAALEADHFGWMGTLGALDIAVIQDKYGVNEEWARGNNTYTIGDVNGPGVFYSSIWDGGGTDAIVYTGERDATIDLRAATLKYEAGGGGRVSFALGAWSGFTIANGVMIENARGGNGDDKLTGNAAANALTGNAGEDQLFGREGRDTLLGGAGNDLLQGGLGDDSISGGAGIDTADYTNVFSAVQVDLSTGKAAGASGVDTLTGIENIRGGSGRDTLTGDGLANRLEGMQGDDTLNGGGGNDVLVGGLGDDALNGGAGVDRASYVTATAGVTVSTATTAAQNTGGAGTDTLTGIEDLYGSAFGDTLRGGVGNNSLWGAGGDDTLNGGGGADMLEGGGGLDTLTGGAGADRFVFARLMGTDVVTDFTDLDTLVLRASSFGLSAGALSASQLQFGAAATGGAGVFLFNAATDTLAWDPDGAGGQSAEAIATFGPAVSLTAADLLLI